MPVYIHPSLGDDTKMVREVLEETRTLAWAVHLTDRQNDIMSDSGWPAVRRAYRNYLGGVPEQEIVTFLQSEKVSSEFCFITKAWKGMNNTILFQLLDKIIIYTTADTTGINANEAPYYDSKIHVDHPDALKPFFNCVQFGCRTILVIRASSMDQFEDRAAIDNPAAAMLGPVLVLYPGFFSPFSADKLNIIRPLMQNKDVTFGSLAASRVVMMYHELTHFEYSARSK